MAEYKSETAKASDENLLDFLIKLVFDQLTRGFLLNPETPINP